MLFNCCLSIKFISFLHLDHCLVLPTIEVLALQVFSSRFIYFQKIGAISLPRSSDLASVNYFGKIVRCYNTCKTAEARAAADLSDIPCRSHVSEKAPSFVLICVDAEGLVSLEVADNDASTNISYSLLQSISDSESLLSTSYCYMELQ